MKNPVNNLNSHIFFSLHPATEYPQWVVDDNGNETLIYVNKSDETIMLPNYTDYKLQSLLSAGIDPSRVVIDTTSSNRVSSIDNMVIAINNLPQSDNSNNNI